MPRHRALYPPSLIAHDVSIVVLSVLIALILVRTDALVNILTTTKEMQFIGSFLAGIFFTSIFTTAPAIVTLGELAEANTLVGTALFGAIGAVVGDLVIFRFVKDTMSAHINDLLEERGVVRRVHKLVKRRMFKWLTLLAGGLLIASPIPDEIAVGLLGASKVHTSSFILLSFVFNFIGIMIIGIIARSL